MEDVKTFFRLLLLLASLFGYQISRNGFVIAHYVQKFSCPCSDALGLAVINPSFVSSMVVLCMALVKYQPKVHRLDALGLAVVYPSFVSSMVVLCMVLVKYQPKVHRLIPSMLKKIGI